MKKSSIIIAASAAVVVCGIGGYMLYDYFVGNHIDIKPVRQVSANAETTGAAVTAEQLSKSWTINDQSKVYFSITTSKETVNFEIKKVQGSWDVNLQAPDQMKALAKGDLNQIDSGNPKRDDHIKSADYFDTSVHPEAVFEAKSFENWPTEWKEGQKSAFKINGVLTVRGVSKDVKFDAQALYTQGKLTLDGTSTVTFADFGLKSPHAVIASTEENIDITLRLALDAAS